MRIIKNRWLFSFLALALVVSITWIISPAKAFADTTRDPDDIIDPVIVVSLGDSYSSGEGITPFYGQEKSLSEKVKDPDWLAHRSTKSWSSQLKVNGYTLGNYRVGFNDSDHCKWYFTAVSGAETKHYTKKQTKDYYKYNGYVGNGRRKVRKVIQGSEKLPTQLSIFDQVEGTADYVTMTLGGNDVDFAKIITTCATNSTYLGSTKLSDQITELWNKFDTTAANIKRAYIDTRNAAGSQAEILVAGYPKLLENTGKGFLISKEEAQLVNKNVHKFNLRLSGLVDECRESGMNIHFVDVEAEFDKDGGHQAYSSDPWINKIILLKQAEDLEDTGAGSAYSVHPNADGAQAYARCVNAKIQEIEASRGTGTLSGRICQAADRITPISEAKIKVYKNNAYYTKGVVDASGDYVITLPIGEYRIEIEAAGYIGFTAYATVERDVNTYMETFLLVNGAEYDTATVSGEIKNGMTGYGIEGVKLTVRSGWNNASKGNIAGQTTTDSDGTYEITLPIGNYTMWAEKDGYISGGINIFVQPGSTAPQNGTLMPIGYGESYRIVLTWGEDPRDLDSHMVGETSDGYGFHVYYSNKNAYDGDSLICNLDVDDTTSYGPETVTLTPTTDQPYYYYVYRYAGSGTVAASGAKVQVYRGAMKVATYNVPTNLGDGDYWNVFAIINGKLVTQNTITSYADVEYALDADTLAASMLAEKYRSLLITMPKEEKTQIPVETDTAETEAVVEETITAEETTEAETAEETVEETSARAEEETNT